MTPVEHEIHDLHRFFQEWFRGEIAPTDEAFARFADVMAEGFEIISPDGSRTPREPLLMRLREAHGAMTDPPIKIWIEDVNARELGGGLWLATYEEWQDRGDGEKARLSTALMREQPGTPDGVEWLHVHETWLGNEKS